jgi:hypothetical protein
MKKLIFIFSFLAAFVFITNAQTIHTFKEGGYNNIAFLGATTDTVGQTAGGSLTLSKFIDMRATTVPYYFYLIANITKLSGNIAGDYVQVQGSMDAATWTVLMNKTLGDATTACVFTRTDSLALGYPYLRVLVTSDGGVGNAKLTSIYGKVLVHKK